MKYFRRFAVFHVAIYCPIGGKPGSRLRFQLVNINSDLIYLGFSNDVFVFEKDILWLKAAIWVVINVGFVAYDIFITMAVRIYFGRIRQKIASMLK